jgi:CTP synthase
MAGELKTKPTQHSVKTLQSLGIQPDILLCRSDEDIPEKELNKISLFCNVTRPNVIPAVNADSIYKVPLLYHKCGLDTQIVKHFGLDGSKIDIGKWKKISDAMNNFSREVNIAIVGKYTSLKESYKSLVEALNHGGIDNNVRVNVVWVEARDIKNEDDLGALKNVAGILVPGGFGKDGAEGKILAIKYAREHNIPFLGICLGMQMAIVEFARNILGLKNANSTEFGSTVDPVVCLMNEWDKNGLREKRDENSDLGGTMRLGGYDMRTKNGSLMQKIYGKEIIRERHRHRYEVNINYREKFEKSGLVFSTTSLDGTLPEAIELPNHKFFVAVQFHPELTSRPFAVNPLFKNFVKNCL